MSNCNKVFCTQCVFFNGCEKSTPCDTTYDCDDIHEQCNAPANIRPTYMSDGSDKYISAPSIINKYNNCKWFVAKGAGGDAHYLIRKHNFDINSHPILVDKTNKLGEKIREVEQKSTFVIDKHLQDLNNPHQVTKGQLGIERVDNTNDLEKPVSVAVDKQLKILDKKIDDSIGSGSTAIVDLRNKLNNEIRRAQQVEGAIQGELSNEEQRAALAEAAISSNVSQIALNLTTETTRAQSVESNLQSSINSLQSSVATTNQNVTLLNNALANETIRAKDEEQEIKSDIERLKTTITSEDTKTLQSAKKYSDDQDIINLDRADANAQAKATKAYEDSKSYTNTVKGEIISTINDTKLEIQSDLDKKADKLTTYTKTEVNSEIDKAKADVKNYTDAQISQSELRGNNYTDRQIDNLTNNVINPGDAATLAASKAFTNQSITDVKANEIIPGDERTLASANQHSDQNFNAAKTYTDNSVSNAKDELSSLITNGDEATLSSSKQYTNGEIAKLKVDAHNDAVELDNNLKNELKGYSDKAASDAETNAKHYSDDKLIDAKTYCDHTVQDLSDAVDVKLSNLATTTTKDISDGDTRVLADSKNYTNERESVINEKIENKYSQSVTYTDNSVNNLKSDIDSKLELKSDIIYVDIRDNEVASEARNHTDNEIARIEAKISSAVNYRGQVEFYSDLEAIPLSDRKNGDLYNVKYRRDGETIVEDGTNYVWDNASQEWDKLTGFIDLSSYYKKDEVDAKLNESKRYAENVTTAAINELDVSSSAVKDQFVTDVIQTDGKISTTRSAITKEQVGLSNVDNTSDKDKPVSDATQDELDKRYLKSETYNKNEIDTKNSEILDQSKEYTDDLIEGVSGGLGAHIVDFDNPHKVSASQIGLGLIPKNKDPAEWDINNKTRDALNLKADRAASLEGYGISDAYTKVETVQEISKAVSVEHQAIVNKMDSDISHVVSNITEIHKTDVAALKVDISTAKTEAIRDAATNSDTKDQAILQLAIQDSTDKDNALRTEINNGTDNKITNLKESYIPGQIRIGVGTANEYTDTQISDLKVNVINPKINEVDTRLTESITSHANIKSGNPHNVSKADLGLDKVENKSPAELPISNATQDALDLKADRGTKLSDYNIIDAYTTEQTDQKITSACNDSVDRSSNITDEKINNAIDGRISESIETAKNSAIIAAENKDEVRAQAAKSYVDESVASTLASSKAFATSEAERAIIAAADDSSAKSEDAHDTAVQESKDYTDGEITKIKAKIESVMHYKGSVNHYSDLLTITVKELGDVYNVKLRDDDTPDGNNYIWSKLPEDSEGFWDKMAGYVDLSAYYTGQVIEDKLLVINNEVATKVTQDDINRSIQNKADKSTSLAGYGITDAVTNSQHAIDITNAVNSANNYTDDQVNDSASKLTSKYDTLISNTKSELISKINEAATKAHDDAVSDAGVLDDSVKAFASNDAAEKVSALGVELRGVITTSHDDAIASAIQTSGVALKAHTDRTDNPHGVTKAHVGLSNVDNTSDKDKPVSDETLRELNKRYLKSETYSKDEIDEIASEKANIDSVYTKSQTDSAIVTAKNAAISDAEAWAHSEDDALETRVLTTAHGYADTAKRESIEESKAYTDAQIASVRDKHYLIKKVEHDETQPSNYVVSDYASNNIDLTGVEGDIYIYMPLRTAALAGKSREFVISVTNRSVGSCTIHFAGQPDEPTSFRDCGILETLSNEKSDFSVKFHEYDNYAFDVDEIGTGDTINNKKIEIDSTQMNLKDDNGDIYILKIVGGQLKIIKK